MLNQEEKQIKKEYRKFSMNEIKNLNDYQNHDKIIECSLCKYISINPFFCKPCSQSFCENCMSEIKITDCPYCKENKLVDATLSFRDFFKDLCIKCSDCSELLYYPQLHNHLCDPNLKSQSTQNFQGGNNPINIEQDECKYIDGVIHMLCKNCLKYIPNPLFNSHICLNNVSNQQNNFTNLNNQIGNKDNLQMNILANTLSSQKLVNIPNEDTFITKKFQDINLENRINKLENVLADFISNFTNTFKNKPKMLDFTNSINSLNGSIIELNRMNQFSFCSSCKSPKKLGDLCPCPCRFCENIKKYCLNCIVVCNHCNVLMSKICRFTCSICKNQKCSFCEEQKDILCLCLENRVCSACHKFNISNNPNLSLQNFLSLKENHNNCKFVKSLAKNVFLIKFFNSNFKLEISLNSTKQFFTIYLCKNKIDVMSKIFSIGNNDVLKMIRNDNKLIISSNEDIWEINLIYLENKRIDYVILNFNMNQEKIDLRKLDNMDFNSLPESNFKFSNVIMQNIIGQRLEEKNIIKSIYFEKI